MFNYKMYAVSYGESGMKTIGSFTTMSAALAQVKSMGIRLDAVPISLLENGIEIFPSGQETIQIRKEMVLAA